VHIYVCYDPVLPYVSRAYESSEKNNKTFPIQFVMQTMPFITLICALTAKIYVTILCRFDSVTDYSVTDFSIICYIYYICNVFYIVIY